MVKIHIKLEQKIIVIGKQLKSKSSLNKSTKSTQYMTYLMKPSIQCLGRLNM